MAKQIGELKLTGTIDNLTCYKMEGEYYVRMKSSLARKRFFKDAAFEGSRRSSVRLATGSKMASTVYRTIPQKKRQYSLFCQMKSLAIKLLKEGRSEAEVMIQMERLVRKSKVGTRKPKMKTARLFRTFGLAELISRKTNRCLFVEIGSLLVDGKGILRCGEEVVDAPG